MREWDIVEELIEIGKRRGTLTYNEINDAFPSEFVSTEDLEDFMDLIQDMGIKVVDNQEPSTDEEEGLDEGRGREKTEDLMQTYFHSMGDISILTKNEEREIAKRLEDGKEIIKGIVETLPLYKKLEARFNGNEEHLKHLNGLGKALNMSLEILENLMTKIQISDKKIARYGTLKDLEKLIKEKRSKGVNPIKLSNLAIEVEAEYKHVESEVGIKVDELIKKHNRITKARELVSTAKNELITRNLRLVVNIAKNYIGRGLPLLDLIQEGNIGLMKAIDKFDYKMGFKFSTYATWWIRQAVTRTLLDQTKTIRVPVHMMELYNKVNKTSRELVSQIGREPSKEEIAEKLGIPTKKVELVFKAIQDSVSLQTPIDDTDSTLEEIISDKAIPSPFTNAEQSNITDQILRVLNTLTPKEEKIIKLRFGIGFEKNYTLEEIGRQFSITRERVRQIEMRAMRKLRHPSRIRALKILNTAS